jgi:regulator of sigma E protease
VIALLHVAVPFAVLLGVLIFVHELGHFLVAKKLGIRVLKFSLGFGPKVVGWTRGETSYMISAIPLGGYVKLFGEDPDEELPPADRAASFSARPATQRVATVLAGPFMNFLLAVVIFAGLSVFGTPMLLPVIGQVSPDMPAAAAGIQPGDQVEAVSGKAVSSWEEMAEAIASSGGEELVLQLRRGSEDVTIRVTPTRQMAQSPTGETTERPIIGISPSGAAGLQRSSPWLAPWIGVRETWRWTWMTVEILGKMIVGRVSPSNLGGPIAIAQMAGETAQTSKLSFILLVAVLSVNLGVLNLLPIPILDGGHAFFFFFEMIRGRPISIRNREVAQQIGLVLLLFLMVYVMYNDIARIAAG